MSISGQSKGMFNCYIFTVRVAQKREDAVSKEVTRKLSEADNRKMSRKEKDERLVLRTDAAFHLPHSMKWWHSS